MTPIFTKNATPRQLPMDLEGVLITGSIARKTERCILNLKATLEEAGSGIGKVVKTVVYLSDMQHFQEMNAEYEKWFLHKPARSCIAVKTLPKNADVEIEAIAIA
ncbi:hypothetical protein LTR10_019312 [Elasticomyces elasticus]|uniref:Uncharacterized protein n=1 Tax=Exophiala sideris TaxID=1016849 RepID=A0ABR0J1C7_9EURO|nr:hypothetical protein LTR10_019312 [Elasticomyces elasticus]KAK5024313.1 hypothetical protein LTS07_008604 [Exophiala sideris]KAK5031005.1 hypothetical protein LTR13_008018 [Exophiala sideris]KAK5054046.1 hypothetical protein LTR69_009008 [Exophiala sideris]KAK5179598.1 hypothetical protein LTR44_008114 [Eurotiomycetes sp. CCFEE 6388]